MKEKKFTNNTASSVVNKGWMRRFALMLMSLFMCVMVNAQTSKITVEGIVLDDLGEPLIGASVTEKGTTNGIMTDVDGAYKLSVESNATLEVTYIGFTSQSIKVDGKTTINITMVEDGKILDEVVVTALGIKRDKKSLGYALQEVKGEALLETRDANVANALSGKIAGLQIKQSGTGPAGSSRIVLRGNGSIGGNNQPLVVVDGVPIDSSTGGSDDFDGNKSIDRGSGMADISPDDIETMSVLKGPAAAALYGSRAGNGVIMITTKTGKGTKGIGISINTNLTFDAPMQTPKYQNIYGQGGSQDEKDAQGNSTGRILFNQFSPNEQNSWGAVMTGQQFKNHVGEDITYAPYNNRLSDFTRTGTTWTNSAEITSATDKNTVRLGIMNMSNKAIVPNSNFSRTSATLRATAQLTKKLSLDAKVTYISQKTKNRVKLGGDPDNIFANYLMMPRSVHFADLNRPDDNWGYGKGVVSMNGQKFNMEGKPVAWTDKYDSKLRNPYWGAYKNTNDDRKHRLIGFGSLKYEITDWLDIQGRYGMDYSSSQYKMRHSTNTPYWKQEGDYSTTKESGYEINADFLINFNKTFGKLGILASMGGNTMYQRNESLWAEAGGLYIPDFFNLSNGLTKESYDTLVKKQINSLYGTASFSWDNMVYFDVTARNDWSSALSPKKRSYFYPSFGASWLFTETMKKFDVNPSFLDYGKVRLSWAEVGNDVDSYRLLDYRKISIPQGGEFHGQKDPAKALYDLKSEKIQSYEIGLEMKAFNGRLGLDFAFYNKDSKDQILRMNVPPATGYKYEYVNAGKVRNRGIELLLSGTPVQTQDFTWDVMLNYSRNKNSIIKLKEGITQQILSDPSYDSMVRIVAEEGGSFGDLYGKAYMRDENGQMLINDKGLPIFDSEAKKLGNASPKWMGGITNTFRYKDFDLSFQIDMRYGGQVYMGSIKTGATSGTLNMTVANRDGMIVPGVFADGTPNDITISGQEYWSSIGGGSEPWIYDATNIRLRELNIGYNLPKSLLAKTFIGSARVSFVGRNLWMIHSKTKGFDPEAGFSTGNAQGFEYGAMPTLRSLGFNINLKF